MLAGQEETRRSLVMRFKEIIPLLACLVNQPCCFSFCFLVSYRAWLNFVLGINAAALTATGDWSIIDKLLGSGKYSVCQGVAEGLRFLDAKRAFEYLFDLLQSDDIYDTYTQLEAANSLSIIGNENTLSKILEWLLEHLRESNTNLLTSVLVYLDRKLCSPIHWPVTRERDFSILHYSMTRDNYR